MNNIIRLKPEDDITSIVGYLWQTDNPVVVFDVPKDSVFIKNQVALKILKREVERTDKEIIFVIKDPADRQTAQRLGFAVRGSLPRSAKILEVPAAVEEETGETLKEMPARDFETMLEREIFKKRGGQIEPVPAAAKFYPDSLSAKKKFSDIQPRDVKINVVREEEYATRGDLKKEINEQLVQIGKNQERDLDVVWPDNHFGPEETKSAARESAQPEETVPLPAEPAKEVFHSWYSSAAEDKEEAASGIVGLRATPPSWRSDARTDSAAERQPEKIVRRKSFFSFRSGRSEAAASGKKSWQEKLDIKNFASDRPEKGAAAVKNKPGANFARYLFFFTGGALLVAALALYFILPKVEVVITPKTETSSANLDVVAAKNVSGVDAATNKIPAQLVKLDKKQSQDFSATGSQQLNEKASGAITIFNEYSSAPQTLVATTRFVSGDNKTFRLTKTIVVPGAKIDNGKIVASSISADVVADQAGDQYNIGPSRFTIPGFQGTPKYNSFYGQSDSAMQGGAKGLATVVSQDDFNKAKNALWNSLQPALDQELTAQLPDGFKLIDGAKNELMSSVAASPDIGQKADKFTLTIKGSVSAILFDENDMVKLSVGKQPGRADAAANEKKEFIYSGTAADFEKGQLSFNVKINQQLVWPVDAEKIKQLILGRSAAQIKELFNQRQEINSARVLFWPFWVTKAPNNLDKVKITVENP